MLLIPRASEHVQVWLDYVFAEQVDVKPEGLRLKAFVVASSLTNSG